MKKIWIGLLIITILFAQQPIQIQTVNGGGAIALGHGVAATSLRVELPTDGTGTVGLIAGSAVIGHVIVDTAPSTVVTGTVTINGAPTTASANALTLFHNSSAAAVNVKASAGNLYGLVLGNSGTVPCWLQVFNSAGTPTAGTSVIDSYLVQAGTTLSLPPNVFALANYATGIAVAGATADSGATTTGCTTTFSVTAYYK